MTAQSSTNIIEQLGNQTNKGSGMLPAAQQQSQQGGDQVDGAANQDQNGLQQQIAHMHSIQQHASQQHPINENNLPNLLSSFQAWMNIYKPSALGAAFNYFSQQPHQQAAPQQQLPVTSQQTSNPQFGVVNPVHQIIQNIQQQTPAQIQFQPQPSLSQFGQLAQQPTAQSQSQIQPQQPAHIQLKQAQPTQQTSQPSTIQQLQQLQQHLPINSFPSIDGGQFNARYNGMPAGPVACLPGVAAAAVVNSSSYASKLEELFFR